MQPRTKEFEIPLADGFYLFVRIESWRGQVTGFVVLLMSASEPHVNLARYDTAHGQPHLDVLGKRRGLLRKEWLSGIRLQDALEYAIRDLKTHYERYRRIYEEN